MENGENSLFISAAREWFISDGKVYLGPMTLAQLQTRAQDGLLGTDDLVWRDGFKDWRLASEVDVLQPLLHQTPPKTTKVQALFKPDLHSGLDFVDGRSSRREQKRGIFWIAATLVILVAGTMMWNSMWLSTLPAVDVSPEDLRALRAAASLPVDRSGPSAWIAPAKNNGSAPMFWIATNLPEADLRLQLQSIADKMPISENLHLIVRNHIAHSTPLAQGGVPIPSGAYKLSVICDSCNGKPMIIERTLYLGGKEHLAAASR